MSGGAYYTLQSTLHSVPSPTLVSTVSWLARRPGPFLTYDDLNAVNHPYITFHLDDRCLLANLWKLQLAQDIPVAPAARWATLACSNLF